MSRGENTVQVGIVRMLVQRLARRFDRRPFLTCVEEQPRQLELRFDPIDEHLGRLPQHPLRVDGEPRRREPPGDLEDLVQTGRREIERLQKSETAGFKVPPIEGGEPGRAAGVGIRSSRPGPRYQFAYDRTQHAPEWFDGNFPGLSAAER
jgi:hypothetical protein